MFSLFPNLITQRCRVPFPSLIELTFSEDSTPLAMGIGQRERVRQSQRLMPWPGWGLGWLTVLEPCKLVGLQR